jgi:hypothetical protein
MFEAKVKCPRCGTVWTVPQASPGIECTCHLFCSSGNKPSDCSVTYPLHSNVKFAWPAGLHNDAADEGDDVLHRKGYCSTHGKYISKDSIWLEVNWEEWHRKRAPEEFRTSRT